MQFGCVSEALMDFTGGVYVTVNLQNENPQRVLELICNANKANSMMGCGTPGKVITTLISVFCKNEVIFTF